ncbi:MAG: hypothetical protein KZQ99_07520 [Candidatus Thiodiazotropha sp. (ex Dulcina madagascariensis)]|nr:hypothetical protein [Candidatus Thiodiazotropha sp. (ex Dulcina madagascariensis)]MCU7927294.1 hypothetical protein [Candidatus Thiodiazotropha sp. (ex Dulcina madagascariensis)]MCU7934713.1 hypothetical protein [Candidatus Thiodiazotropha sp. (ex Dulcina madagascariensis)]
MSNRGWKLGISPFLILLLIWGCSDQPPTPEQQLRALIAEAETHLEARDLSAAMAFVDPAYRDSHGRDYRQLRAMLAGYFLRHGSIHILSRIKHIEIKTTGDAQVLVYAGLAGSPEEAAKPLSQWRGDLLRLQFHFVGDEGEWLLKEVAWRRVRPEDFIL